MPFSGARPSLDEYYLEMLVLVASRSTCVRRAVGAIITTGKGQVLSTGYNGVSSGLPHCIDTACDGAFDDKGDTRRCLAVHAEANAILQCSHLEYAHTMYCSCTPCFECAKLILNTSIRRVVFPEIYPAPGGIDLLTKAGIQLVHLPR